MPRTLMLAHSCMIVEGMPASIGCGWLVQTFRSMFVHHGSVDQHGHNAKMAEYLVSTKRHVGSCLFNAAHMVWSAHAVLD